MTPQNLIQWVFASSIHSRKLLLVTVIIVTSYDQKVKMTTFIMEHHFKVYHSKSDIKLIS